MHLRSDIIRPRPRDGKESDVQSRASDPRRTRLLRILLDALLSKLGHRASCTANSLEYIHLLIYQSYFRFQWRTTPDRSEFFTLASLQAHDV